MGAVGGRNFGLPHKPWSRSESRTKTIPYWK